jgi:hypothetical protein
VLVNEIGAQNYIFVEPVYDAERVYSLFAQNLYGQIHYTFYGKLASSGTEARVDFLLRNFVRAQVARNFPKMLFRDAGNVGAGIVQSCSDAASNLGVNVRPVWF